MSRRVAVFREDESGKIHRYFIYTRTRKVTEPFYQHVFVLGNKSAGKRPQKTLPAMKAGRIRKGLSLRRTMGEQSLPGDERAMFLSSKLGFRVDRHEHYRCSPFGGC